MLALIQYNLVPLAVAASIGIATARWMFPSRAAPKPKAADSEPS